jgi:hypothetical protein
MREFYKSEIPGADFKGIREILSFLMLAKFGYSFQLFAASDNEN